MHAKGIKVKISKKQLRRIIKEQWTPADAGAAAAAAEARGIDFRYLQNLWNNAAAGLESAADTAAGYDLDSHDPNLLADMHDLVKKAYEISEALSDHDEASNR